MIEVASDERNINVAAFANGLAVIERFEDGEAAGMFLDLAGKRVEETGAGVERALARREERYARRRRRRQYRARSLARCRRVFRWWKDHLCRRICFRWERAIRR